MGTYLLNGSVLRQSRMPTPSRYHAMTMRDGLVSEALAELRSTLNDMLGSVQAAEKDHRILTIGLEDFSMDFDGTIRRIFTHLLGSSQDKLIPKLVELSAVHDVGRWPAEKRTASKHIASSESEAAVVRVLESLQAEGEPSIRKVY